MIAPGMEHTIATTNNLNTPSEPIDLAEPILAHSPSDLAIVSAVPASAPAPPSPTAATWTVPPSPALSNHNSDIWPDLPALRNNEIDGYSTQGDTSQSLELSSAIHTRRLSLTSYATTAPHTPGGATTSAIITTNKASLSSQFSLRSLTKVA
jgi:hypothetical protein